MTDELKSIQQHAAELEQANTTRNNLFQDMEDMYFMTWSEEARVSKQIENVKLTKSPRPRTAIQGAIRLLIASDPIFSVPHDINSGAANDMADRLERFAKAMWFSAGRITGDPIHYDVVRSALLFSEIHIAVTSTKDLKDYAAGGNPAHVDRVARIADTTPYLFDVWHPRDGYPEWSSLGLDSFYRKVKVTSGYVQDMFGAKGEEALKGIKSGNLDTDRYQDVTLNDFWDLKNRCVWVEGSPTPIIQEAHGLPFIPIVAQIVEGSKLFEDKEKQREPFLRTLRDSKLWERENLLLTVLYTMIFGIGANPMYLYRALDPDADVKPDFSVPGGLIKIRAGEAYEPLAKQVIDPSVLQGWNIATDLEMQSTIYRQTLGEPLGANAPYSMVAILSQSGRLPLTVPQRKTSWGIGEALELAFRWLKKDGTSGSAYYQNDEVSVAAADIPDRLKLEATLEINLPQDRLQAANAANMLTMGESPLVSKAWVRQNVLNIGQPDDMTRQIWDEQASEIFYQQFTYDQLMQMAQKKQMAMQPGAASGMPGGMPVGPGPAGQPTPMQPTLAPEPAPFPPMEPLPPIIPNQLPME